MSVPSGYFPANSVSANYLVRIVLPHATYADYVELHGEMALRGFVQQIFGDNGLSYDLPPAEYRGFSTASVTALRDELLQMATNVRPGASIYVAEIGASAWYLPLTDVA